MCASARALSSARTDWRAASTRSLRSCPTRSTRHERATAPRSSPRAMRTARSKSLTMAAVSRSNGTKTSSATTGSWSSASCTQAASTRTTPAKTMSFHLVSTVSVPARRSIPRSTWTSPLSVTASSTACTLKRAKTRPAPRKATPRRRRTRAKPARPSAGSPIWRYSRISTSLWIIIWIRSSGRRSSTATSSLC